MGDLRVDESHGGEQKIRREMLLWGVLLKDVQQVMWN